MRREAAAAGVEPHIYARGFSRLNAAANDLYRIPHDS